MTPAATLVALAEAGVVLWVERGRLRFRAPEGALSPELRAAASACRGGLVALVLAGGVLPARPATWPGDWKAALEERIGIMEFEGGLPRGAVERVAERVVRLEHARAFVARGALAVNTPAAAVARTRRGSGPHRRS